MLLNINLDQVTPPYLHQTIATGNYRKVSLNTHQQVDQLSHIILPIITIIQQYPLIEWQILPQQLKEAKYDIVALGGTFDYFHVGHQLLLLNAIELAKKQIIVGITADQLLSKKKNKTAMQTLQLRRNQVYQYILKIKPNLLITLPDLQDPYGPTITREDINAIVVSHQTLIGAKKINEIRKQKQFTELQIDICQMISPVSKEDINCKISSSDIRKHILKKNQFTQEQFIKYKQYWHQLQNKLRVIFELEQIAFESISDKYWGIIMTQYSQYWRFYHTNRHIFDMLSQYQQCIKKYELNEISKLIIQISIWFHDIEYIPVDKLNEEKSAQAAQQYLYDINNLIDEKQAKNKLQQMINKVKSAIISTKTHKTQIFEEKLLIDIDMSILNSKQETYQNYANQIKQQYQPYVRQKYAEKRRQFLLSMNVSEIYYFQEDIANLKANIQWELNQLAKQINSNDL